MLRTLTLTALIAGLVCVPAQGKAPQAAQPAGNAVPIIHPVAPLTTVTRNDVRVGETLRDPSGRMVGLIKKVTAGGALVSTGASRAVIPFAGMRRSSAGLFTSFTKAQIDKLKQEKRENYDMLGPM